MGNRELKYIAAIPAKAGKVVGLCFQGEQLLIACEQGVYELKGSEWEGYRVDPLALSKVAE